MQFMVSRRLVRLGGVDRGVAKKKQKKKNVRLLQQHIYFV